jgi:hypothetical protein
MNTAKYINIDQVIKSYMGEAELTGAAYLRLYQIAIRGYDDLWLDISGKAKTRILAVLPNKTAELPGDYINWSKVGVINEQGEVATLRLNNNLTLHASTDDNRLNEIGATPGVTVNEFVPTDFINYFDETLASEVNLFGLPAGTQNLGEFKVDEDAGVIIFGKMFTGGEIVLEYLASPYEDGETVMVPVQIKEALLAWIAWRDIASKASSRRVNNTEKIIRKREYYNQRKLARRRIHATRRGQLNDTIRLNANLVLKA